MKLPRTLSSYDLAGEPPKWFTDITQPFLEAAIFQRKLTVGVKGTL